MRLPVRTAAAAALTLLAAGCGSSAGAVSVTVPTGPAGGEVCTTLSAALPAVLDGRKRRTTSPVSARVTAWGSPAVVLRCGVATVDDTTGDHVTVDGVGWRTAGPAHGTVVWTTTDRSTALELSVPDSVNDQETLLGELAPAVSRTVSRVAAPSGAATSGAPAASGAPTAPTAPTASSLPPG